MKNLFIIAFLPFIFLACTIEGDIFQDDDVKMEERVTKEFNASQYEKLEITNSNGDIESDTANVDSIEITFHKWATGHDEDDAEMNLDDVKIYVDRDSKQGVLKIDVKNPHSFGESYGCDIFITLPKDISLLLDSSNGELTVDGSKNDIECYTSNGKISTSDTEGNAILKTSNGSINVKNHFGNIEGKSSNGKIDADIALPKRGECFLKTSNGSITLSIPSDTSAEISANTSSGRVEIKNLDIDVSESKRTEIEGKIGDGDGIIELETSNGNITIKGSEY